MREHAERIGVSFKSRQVGPFGIGEPAAEVFPGAFAEKRRDSPFSGVSERRITQIVRQAGCGDDVAEMVEVFRRLAAFAVAATQRQRDSICHRLADARHFHAVSEAVVNEDAPRKREHLRFVLQTAERRGENETVVVAPEIGAGGILLGVVVVLKSETLVVDEPLPVHYSAA